MMNVCRKILKNSKGFSLMEMVVAVGITGVVSLGVLQLSENQNKIQNHAKSKSAEKTIINNAKLSLLTSVGCSASLVGTTIPAPPAEVNITQIVDHSGRVVMRAGETFGDKNNITLSAITLRATGTPSLGDNLISLNTTTTRTTNGEIDKSFTNSILIKVDLDSSNTITDCFTSVGPLTNNLGEQFCLSTAGSWDSGSNICSYSPPCPTQGTGLPNQVITSNCLQDRESTEYDTNYIGQNTDNTVTGNLNINNADLIGAGSVTARSEICIGSNCRDFSLKSCPNNQRVMRGIEGDGDLTCHPNALLCSGTSYFAGISSSGNNICRPVPLTSCTNTNYYIKEILADGTLVCEPVPVNAVTFNDGFYIREIPPTGSPAYSADRHMKEYNCPSEQYIISANGGVPTCGNIDDTNVFGQECPSGEAVTGYTSAGVIECAPIGGGTTCTPTYSPLPSEMCSGVSFTQTNSCDSSTMSATGTSTTGTCAFSCTGSVPANADPCSVSGLTSDKAYAHATTCSGAANTCEFSCSSGHTWDGSACAPNFGFDCPYATAPRIPSDNIIQWADTDNDPAGSFCQAFWPTTGLGLNNGNATALSPDGCINPTNTTEILNASSGQVIIVCSAGTLQVQSFGTCECSSTSGGFGGGF